MKLLIIGAGQSGRGFIPQFTTAQDKLVFVDKNHELINQLKVAGQYNIRYYGTEKRRTIQNFEAYTWEDLPEDAVDSCDFIATSVGEENFSEAIESLKKFKTAFQKVFITFENGTSPAEHLEKVIEEAVSEHPTVTQAAIFTTTTNEGIDIASQDYLMLAYDCERYTADFPFRHCVPTSSFGKLLQRKIYTYNCLSAVISYPGAYFGYENLSEAAHDPRIAEMIEEVLRILNPALAGEFQITQEEQEDFAGQALQKFRNPHIYDPIERNVRAVERKLGLKERLFGPISIVEKAGINANALYRIVAYALYYNKNEKSPLATLLSGTGLEEAHHFIKRSLEEYDAIFGIS
ncbi:mannitol dehydrogenase family protein [Lactovum odontotermitis]